MGTSGYQEYDKWIYVKDIYEGYIILYIYIDDMIIVGSNDKVIQSTKDMLNSKFDIKDMGLANVILGVKITRTSDESALSKPHYIDKILGKINKSDRNVAVTSCRCKSPLTQEGEN